MTEEEIKNKISEYKECCKKLAEEYRQRYNEDNADKLALNMFYHNVISYNDFETVLAIIEDRNSMMMCFSEPPYLTEETVEVDIKRIAELEKENAELKRENRGIKTCANCDEYVIGRCCNYPNGVCHHWKLSEKYRSDDELTNAKEIIRDLINLTEPTSTEEVQHWNETFRKAEQFLKE